MMDRRGFLKTCAALAAGAALRPAFRLSDFVARWMPFCECRSRGLSLPCAYRQYAASVGYPPLTMLQKREAIIVHLLNIYDMNPSNVPKLLPVAQYQKERDNASR